MTVKRHHIAGSGGFVARRDRAAQSRGWHAPLSRCPRSSSRAWRRSRRGARGLPGRRRRRIERPAAAISARTDSPAQITCHGRDRDHRVALTDPLRACCHDVATRHTSLESTFQALRLCDTHSYLLPRRRAERPCEHQRRPPHLLLRATRFARQTPDWSDCRGSRTVLIRVPGRSPR